MSGETAPTVRVLIVEDETLVAMLLEDMLGDAGYVISAVINSIDQALQFVRDDSAAFDFAILDVNLGGEPIFPVAEALAERDKPFAFATGYGNAGLPPEWRSRPTLQKPFSTSEVENIVASTMASGHTRRPEPGDRC